MASRTGTRSPAASRLEILAILAAAGGAIAWLGRGIGFFGDQWRWIFDAVHPTVGQAFRDWDSHLMATTFGLFDLLPRTAGLSELWPYRAVALVLHLGVVWAVYALASRRIGPRAALAPAAVVAVLGSGGEVFLTSLDYNALIATLACLAALLMVDRRTFRADLVACALLIVGVGSFTNALAYAAGLAVELFARERLRRLWVALTPIALYAVWRIEHGLPTAIAGDPSHHPFTVLRESAQIAAGAFAGVAGVQLASTPHAALVALTVALVVLLALLLAIRGRLYRDPRLLNLVVTGAVLWLMIGYARGARHDLYGSRYVYQGAVVAALLLVELWIPFVGRSRLAAAALAVATLTSVALNAVWMVDAGHYWRSRSATVRAKLAGLEIARDTASPDYRPGAWAVEFVTASRYFRAVKAFGSAGETLAQLRRDGARERRAADGVLVGAGEIRLRRLAHAPHCTRVAPSGLTVPAASRLSLVSAADATVHIGARRFGDEYMHVADFKGAARIDVALGRAPDPWHLQVASNAAIRLCASRSSLR